MRLCVLFAVLALAACSRNGADDTGAIGAPASWPPADLRACTADADCRPAPACCPAPCTADVIHVRYVAAAEARLKQTCDPAEECPDAGDCVEHAYQCVSGACKLVYADDPAYRGR